MKSGTIPKGYTITRVSNSNKESLDHNRKYVSLLSRPVDDFDDILYSDTATKYTYKAKKDLKIANVTEVQDAYVDTYLPKREAKIFKQIRDGQNYIMETNQTANYWRDWRKETDTNALAQKWVEAVDYELVRRLGRAVNWQYGDQTQYKKMDKVMQQFKDAGYDATPNIVDGAYRTINNATFAQGSVIILDPKTAWN